VYGKNGMVVAPTRLIDVGTDDGSELPRLVSGRNCLRGEQPGYLVLSYCWGVTPRDAPWKLTTENMAKFEEALPMDVLPQTLHDAILWTRRLDMRYIWIDSMCIIQDSAQDWQRESMRMASIYGSAVLTLVAASGSVYGGLTDRRSPLKNCAASLPLKASSTGEERKTVYILPAGQKRSTPLPIPTEDRAWCYQEDVLSPKLLKFTPSGLVWECVGNTSVSLERAQGLQQLTGLETWKWWTIWYRINERYTRRKLTFPKDKLTAFSGIAADKGGPGPYLAGILEDDILAGMLWCRDETLALENPGKRYGEYIAPSWSWASLEVPVRYFVAQQRAQRKKDPEPTLWDPVLHGADVVRSSYNTMGPVSGGFVDLTAWTWTGFTTSEMPELFRSDGEEGANYRLAAAGRRRLLAHDSTTNASVFVGEVVFDVLSEAMDRKPITCILLQVSEADEWVKTGVAGIAIALGLTSPDRAAGKPPKCVRVGYVRLRREFLGVVKRVRSKIY
jgi:hypothetical protein